MKVIRIVFETDFRDALKLCIMKLILGIIPAVYIIVYAEFVDSIVMFYHGNSNTYQLLMALVKIIGISLFQYCGSNLNSYFIQRCIIRIEKGEKERLIEKCSKIAYAELENDSFINELYNIEKGIPQTIIKGFYSYLNCLELCLNVISILLIVGKYSVVCMLIILVCFIPVVKISITKGKENYEAVEKYQKVERRKESFEDILLSLNYVCERNIYNYLDWIMEKWNKEYIKASDMFLKFKKESYFSVKSTSICIKMLLWGIVGIVIIMTIRSSATIGTCTMLIGQILSLANKMTWNLSAYLYEIANIKNFMKSYDKLYTKKEMSKKKIVIDKIKDVEFNNVSFRYSDETPYVLNGLSFKLTEGKSYAFVGENGAGKSTIMKLLLGLYEHYEGNILINGIELREISNLSSEISAVFQDFTHYEVSVRDNIAMGNEEVEEYKIYEYMNALDWNDNGQGLEKNLSTVLGRLQGSAIDLSGGQWQKIAMLRAMLHKGDFLVLDEPTAALDPIAENKIYRNFTHMMQQKTILLITHRLGAARLADEIIVIADGKVGEIGTHEDLLEKKGLYSEMFISQRGWYEDNAL